MRNMRLADEIRHLRAENAAMRAKFVRAVCEVASYTTGVACRMDPTLPGDVCRLAGINRARETYGVRVKHDGKEFVEDVS